MDATQLQSQSPREALRPPWEGPGGLSASALKTIAIIAMVIDHAARAFVTDYYSPLGLTLHMIGRITGPMMFFFIAEGYHRTRRMNRYTLRLAVFAAVSYLPFIYFRTGGLPNSATWLDLNVIYTLLLGHLMLRARHEVKEPALRVILMTLCIIASFPGDWGFWALLYILVFDTFRGNFGQQALGYAVLTLGQMLPWASRLVMGLLQGGDWASVSASFSMVLIYAAFFLPLLLLRFYNGRRGGGNSRFAAFFGKWFFYLVYPAHLLLLGWLQKVITVRF